MDVADAHVGTAQRGVHRRVVVAVAEFLIEADRHLEGGSPRKGVLRGEIAEQGAGGDGNFPHPSLDEIASQRRLGKDDEPRGVPQPGNL